MKRRLCAILLMGSMILGSLGPAASAASFSDVSGGHWAAAYIDRAHREGWVQGVGGSYYAPSRTLTAVEFFTMVCNALFPEELAPRREDGPWYTQVWTLTRTRGLQQGTSMTGEEDLTKPVPRRDMAQIICNALAARGLELPTGSAQSAFSDWGSVPESFRPAVSAAHRLGILNGREGGTFAPNDSMTRAEAAAVLCRMVDALAEPDQAHLMTMADQVVTLVNRERAKAGLQPLGTYDSLTRAAKLRAGELVTSYSHTRPNGSSCYTALDETGAGIGASAYGENIAAGFDTAEKTMKQWLDSEAHRANILSKEYTHIGVACVPSETGYGWYWVQLFISRR